jgi:hypothetical protein
MLWGLADHFVDEVIGLYRSREQAEKALRAVLEDEPDWAGMMEVVPVQNGHWQPKGKPVPRPRCRQVFARP